MMIIYQLYTNYDDHIPMMWKKHGDLVGFHQAKLVMGFSQEHLVS